MTNSQVFAAVAPNQVVVAMLRAGLARPDADWPRRTARVRQGLGLADVVARDESAAIRRRCPARLMWVYARHGVGSYVRSAALERPGNGEISVDDQATS